MRQRLPVWASAAVVGAALVALVAWSFCERWRLLAASPFPLGVDGFFYPVQLRALLDHGALAYPSSPLAFYLLAPFAAASDPITGAKLGAAFYGAVIALPAYGVGARLGGRGAGLVAAALATTSVGSIYLTTEFVKNGIGLSVALIALWLVLRAADQPTRVRIAAAIAGVAAACAAHKMAAALVLLVAIPAGFGAATAHGALRGRRLLFAIGVVAAAAVAGLAVGAAAPERLLSAGDARLVRGLVSATPRWNAPALALPTGALALGHDALLGLGLGLAGLVVRLRRGRRRAAREIPVTPVPPGTPAVAAPHTPAVAAAAWPILLLAIAIGLPFLAVTDREGLGFRLRLAAFVPAALAAAIVARDVLGRHARREVVLAGLALVLVGLRRPHDGLAGQVVTHPALVAAAQALNGHVPAGATLIVPERHIAFMLAWYTGAPIAIRPERIPADRRLRVLPLHFVVAGSLLDHQLMAARAEPSLAPPLGVHPRHPNGLVAVPEPTWRWILERLPAADRARFTAWPTI